VARPVPVRGGNVPPTTLASYVTAAIRSGILDGRYPLGSRLDQQTLADEFGASIIPVRESLRQLEAEGLIQIAPRRGAFVVSPTVDEVREVYRLRAMFEAFATKEAVPALSGASLAQMDGLLAQMARTGRGNTYDNWSRLNQEWHFALYAGAASPLLMQFIGTLWDRCRLTSNVYARDLSHRSRSNADHEQIMTAVHAGQEELAAKLISTHVSNAMDDILNKNMIQALDEPTAGGAAGAIPARA
jgi:DNA-binding GntR family transcriptional regulator